MQEKTITAIATPTGIGAVGMVRISGENAKNVLAKLWISSHHPVDSFVTHRLYYGKVVSLSTDKLTILSEAKDPPKSPDKPVQPIDNVLAVWMQAPHSFTGEDVVEIFCHGGSYSSKMVLEAVLLAGARMAEPGEFTKRAFLNGKIDLAQAEGVAEVIGAVSERAYRLAGEQLEGKLSQEINHIQTSLKEIKAFVEATIDFPEEDVEFLEHGEITKKIDKIYDQLTKLSSTYNEGRLIHDGVRVVIVGKPNVGKSSLLNALLECERAIVHHSPGTTRDTIEETIIINGVLFRLVDTAGIHDSSCEVEKIGISRSKIKINEADLILVVLDPSRPIEKEDEQILNETSGLERMIVINKTDVAQVFRPAGITDLKVCATADTIKCSAKTRLGIDNLKSALINFVNKSDKKSGEGVIIANLRHKNAIDESIDSLLKAKDETNDRSSAEFIAHHLQSAMNSLGKITGFVTTDDVLNEIFSKFCIGK